MNIYIFYKDIIKINKLFTSSLVFCCAPFAVCNFSEEAYVELIFQELPLS